MRIAFPVRELRIFFRMNLARLLTADQKCTKLITFTGKADILSGADPSGFFQHFRNQYEFRVRHFEPKTKRQSMQFETPLLTCSRVSKGRFLCGKDHGLSILGCTKHFVVSIFTRATPSVESTMLTCWGSYKKRSQDRKPRKMGESGLVSSG